MESGIKHSLPIPPHSSSQSRTSEVPKSDGSKEAEAWTIESRKTAVWYCFVIGEDIQFAMGIAMTGKLLWWDHEEKGIT